LDTPYEIEVVNRHGVNKGVKKVVVDGKDHKGNEIQLINDGKTHKVKIYM
jgi:cellobiose phosphorylase